MRLLPRLLATVVAELNRCVAEAKLGTSSTLRVVLVDLYRPDGKHIQNDQNAND